MYYFSKKKRKKVICGPVVRALASGCNGPRFESAAGQHPVYIYSLSVHDGIILRCMKVALISEKVLIILR